jgi:seryl-tRNA(Sec) selenium transferase
LRGDQAIPVLEMLHLANGDLRDRAERIIARLDGLPLVARVGTGRAQIGGGTLPRSAMPSITLDLTHSTLTARQLVGRLREQPVPVIGYIMRGIVKLDLRTIFARQDDYVVGALRAISG